MPLSSYHVHSCFCDGHGDPEEYVLSALKNGFQSIGFSSHAPMPFPYPKILKIENLESYLSNIRNLKAKYAGQIEIYASLELDYFEKPEYQTFYLEIRKRLDYTLASIHFMQHPETGKLYGIDSNLPEFQESIEAIFAGDIKAYVKKYYSMVEDMVRVYQPDIIGHFDVLKKYNKQEAFFREEETWYREIVCKTLDTIADSKSIVEVNTGGLARGSTVSLYPSLWILKECRKRGIPLAVNSDAHHPDQIASFYERAEAEIKEAGYDRIRVLKNGTWQDSFIDS